MKARELVSMLALATLSLSLSGCMHTYRVYGGTQNLSQLKRLYVRQGKLPQGTINNIRLSALKTSAMSIGAQSGLVWRAKQIDDILDQDAKQLDKIFDFRQMMVSQHVLPRVLTQADNTLSISDGLAIRLSDKVYKIESQARLVTAPPTWREYLYMNYSKPDKPSPAMLPHNRFEKKVWQKLITKSWHMGIDQANAIYQQNLARLKSDYTGMALYHKLYAQKMVSAPFVSHANLGITGDTNEMRIHDQVLRITALPVLKTNKPHQWRPAVIKTNG